jgi:hypothetical protein
MVLILGCTSADGRDIAVRLCCAGADTCQKVSPYTESKYTCQGQAESPVLAYLSCQERQHVTITSNDHWRVM